MRGKSVAETAKHIGMASTTLYSRINRHTEFSLAELRRIKRYLELDDSELIQIFFDNPEG